MMSRSNGKPSLRWSLVGLLLVALSLPTRSSAESHRIFLDGLFGDWDDVAPLYEDAIGDQQAGELDFGRLWVANDENYFYFSVEVGVEIILQEYNEVRLYLDTDDDPATGTAINGIGADLYWTFGLRSGRFYVGLPSYAVYQYKIGLRTAPTVTSARFEIGLDRAAMPVGQTPLFPGDTVAIALKDMAEGLDLLPDQGTQIRYVFDDTPLPPLEPLTLDRQDSTHLRILSYNVHLDDFFELWAEEAYTRILNAVDPDVIGFQEIYDHNVWDTIARVEMMLGGTWYGEKINPDIIVVSKYPFLDMEAIDGNGAYLIDLEADYDCRMLLIDCHLPAGQNNFDRQMEVDAVMAFIRDAKAGTGAMALEENTPILILGDMNFVGYSTQLETFLTGNIVYQGQHGAPFDPDWDGSDFLDLLPRHTETPFFHTWIDGESSYSYSPGRLDFMIYSDYVMTRGTNFVLHTPSMSPDALAAWGLQSSDTDIASDHLPVVSDFWLHLGVGVEPHTENPFPAEFNLEQNYPNPFNSSTVLSYQLPVMSHVELAVFDLAGRRVTELVNGRRDAGIYEVSFNASRLPSGIYFARLTAGDFRQTRKLLLLK